jgi:ABC-type amino acid transport substrate-binding protein
MATVDTPYTYEPLGIALPANDPLLVNWVENFLASLEGSGDLSRLRARWFLDGSWISKLP